MHELLHQLSRDHANLARLLQVLERQLDDFHAGHEHDLDLLCELVEYLSSYEDQIHHPTEELVFARLGELAGDRQALLDTLAEQHRSLAAMTKKFRDSLEAIMHEGVVLRQAVEDQGRAMVGLLREHMALEDREALPLAGRLLQAADWAWVLERAPKYNDPVFGNPDPARFRTLFQHLAEELGLARPV
jgi:hemerythrin-like domain-containing protein